MPNLFTCCYAAHFIIQPHSRCNLSDITSSQIVLTTSRQPKCQSCVQSMPISKRTQLHGCKCILLPFSSELSPAPSSAFTSEVSPVPSSTLTSSTTTGDPHYLYIILNPLNSLPVFLTVLMPHKVHTYTVRSCTAGLCSVCHVSSKLFQYEQSSRSVTFQKIFIQYRMQVKQR